MDIALINLIYINLLRIHACTSYIWWHLFEVQLLE
jgi:hypothetical protein